MDGFRGVTSKRPVGKVRSILALMGSTAAMTIGLLIHPVAAGNFCLLDVGAPSTPPGSGAFACGPGANANGESSTAIGYAAANGESGSYNTSVGYSAGRGVYGSGNTFTGAPTINPEDAIEQLVTGAGADTKGNGNSGYGSGAAVGIIGDENSAFGADAGRWVNGSHNVAMGAGAGSGTLATPLEVNDTVAIGTNALAAHDNSIAIGSGVTTSRVNQVAIGTDENTYTLAGITSSASSAAQSGDVYVVTTDSAGNLAASAFPVPDLSSVNGRIDEAFSRIDTAYEGSAMAMAMAGAGLPADKNYAVSINWGNFEGSNAFAGTAQARVSENFLLHGGIGYGASNGSVGGRAGMTFAW